MTKIVFFDVDGTLMTPKNQLPESTKLGIKQLKENGHIPIISTGRPPKMLEAVAKDLEIDNYISLNGQHIVMNDEIIFSNPLPTEALEDLMELSYEQGDRTFLMTADQVIGNTFMNEMMDPDFLTYVSKHLSQLPTEVTVELFKHMTEKPLPRETYENEDVLMAFVHTLEEKDSIYQKHSPELHFTRATPLLGEAIMKGSHKATAMEKVLAHLGLPIEDTVAFGDGLNDLEMLKFANMGVAMGNGREELKAVSDYVTADVEANGIYEGLKHLKLI